MHNTAALVAIFLGVCLLLPAVLAVRWFLLWFWRVASAADDLKRIADALERISRKE